MLESLFGSFKNLEGEHATKSGFGGSILAIAAKAGQHDETTIKQALESTSADTFWKWCHETLGETIQTQRSKLREAVKSGFPEMEVIQDNSVHSA